MLEEDKPKKSGRKGKKHSPETIKKMSERRRARTTQPRSGTSKKRQNLAQELLHEYKDSPHLEELKKWLKDNPRIFK